MAGPVGVTAAASSVVPACPNGLTIAREDFLADRFTPDAFLAQWSAAASAAAANSGRPRTLETLRDDLGIYLKVLRSAMIELINDDYADFVNLSTNLVGLDKGIAQLQEPLIAYQAQVREVQHALESTLQALNEKLAKRERLYEKKIALQNLEHITHTLAKVERLLGMTAAGAGGESSPTPRSSSEVMSGDLVERVATEINHLNFCVSKCTASKFVEEMQPRLKAIGDRLHASLETQLLEALADRNVDVLKRCLRIYATVDRVGDAENLVRLKVIRPALEEAIKEDVLLEDTLGFQGMVQCILKVIPSSLTTLLQLTKLSPSGGSRIKSAKEYDFLGRAFFPEVVDQIDENVATIFSAGNPEKFFLHYTTSMEFLSDFERELDSVEAVTAFRESPAYKTFMGRWNLAIYFQIRFQEIALPVETSIAAIFDCASEVKAGPAFLLQATHVALQAVERCWSSGIFIRALSHRFWKLTLQIITRFSGGVGSAPELAVPSPTGRATASIEDEQQQHLKPSATVATNMKDMGNTGVKGMSHTRSASFAAASQPEDVAKEEAYKSRPGDLIRLWLDVRALACHLEAVVLPDVILPQLGDLSQQQKDMVSAAFGEAVGQLKSNLDSLSSLVVAHVSQQCLPSLRQVSDIPRLYRRTNREVPSRPCGYVTSTLSPAEAFKSEHGSGCGEDVMRQWMILVFSKVAAQFLSNVSEVLAAVQKMEESLRRLKRVRDSKTSLSGLGSGVGDTGKAATVSDDDKIRLQLYLDVCHFLNRLRSEFGVEVHDVESSPELLRVVEEATAGLAEVREQLEKDC